MLPAGLDNFVTSSCCLLNKLYYVSCTQIRYSTDSAASELLTFHQGCLTLVKAGYFFLISKIFGTKNRSPKNWVQNTFMILKKSEVKKKLGSIEIHNPKNLDEKCLVQTKSRPIFLEKIRNPSKHLPDLFQKLSSIFQTPPKRLPETFKTPSRYLPSTILIPSSRAGESQRTGEPGNQVPRKS